MNCIQLVHFRPLTDVKWSTVGPGLGHRVKSVTVLQAFLPTGVWSSHNIQVVVQGAHTFKKNLFALLHKIKIAFSILYSHCNSTDLHCNGLSLALVLEPTHQFWDRTSLHSSAHQNVHLNLQSHTADPERENRINCIDCIQGQQKKHWRYITITMFRAESLVFVTFNLCIKTIWMSFYHQHRHLETSPWSPHWSDEGPAVLNGIITLHSPQTLLSVVASCRDWQIFSIKCTRGIFY